MMPPRDTAPHDEFEGPSKSALKRQSAEWQALGERLMSLDPSHWQSLPLSDSLLRALEESKRIHSHEALRRHRQYIGKLMRDENVDSIAQYLSGLEAHRELNTRAFHTLEALREQLITQGTAAMGEVLAKHPTADSQKLRQLIRMARQEREQGASQHRHARELFRFLRALESADLSGAGD